MEVPDVPIEVVRRFLDSDGETEVMAAVATVSMKKITVEHSEYVARSQMVLLLMRAHSENVTEDMIVAIEHCIAKAGGPHEHQ